MYKFAFLFCLSAYLSYHLISYTQVTKHKLFTVEELRQFDGIKQKQLYIAILGLVYDVTEGASFYGPGQTYHGFVGRDNSRSFVTGRFDDASASDDVVGLNGQDLRALNHWVGFYKSKYRRVGKLIGRYYDERGKKTPLLKEIRLLIKAAEEEDANSKLDKYKFPPCNVEWEATKGSRVWCSKKSGGFERDWIGVPRKYYEPGATSYRCACIGEENKRDGRIEEYEGCDPTSEECNVIE